MNLCCGILVQSWLWNASCDILAMESWLQYPGCRIRNTKRGCGTLAMEPWQGSPGCGSLAVMSWLWSRDCGIVAVESWLRNPDCGILAVVSLAEITWLIWEASRRHLGDTREASGGLGRPWEAEGHLGRKMLQIHCVLQHLSSRPAVSLTFWRVDLHVDL